MDQEKPKEQTSWHIFLLLATLIIDSAWMMGPDVSIACTIILYK